MLTIIHGSDIVASRKYFLDEKQKHPESLAIEADGVNITDLAQVIEGGGLFGESKFIFIEQFLTKRKKSGDYKDIITYLDTHAEEHTIFLWENKELDIGTQKAFKKALVRPFKLPQTLFALLDNLQPGKGQLLIKQFHETIESTEVEMVFFMLIRQLRMLLALHPKGVGSDAEIDEVKRLTWQRAKMQKQAEMFGQEVLIDLYNKLYSIEKGQKTGTLGMPLITAIDFFLLEV
jgi:DNA polymerase III delta subunit